MYMHIHSRACAESLFSVRLLSFSDTLSFTALIHSLTLQRSLNGSPVPFLPRQNHLSFKIHSKHPRSDLRLLLSVTASLSFATSSLFLSFCPFSASANDSRLFIPRLCIARERARALLRLLTTAVPSAASVLLRRYFASLPFRSLLLSSVSFFSPSFS